MDNNTAVYFHKEVFSLSKNEEEIEFIGQSLPYFRDFSIRLAKSYQDNNLPLRKENFTEYSRVHAKEYLDSIIDKAGGRNTQINTSVECTGLEYAIPGYEYSLGGLYSAVDFVKRNKNGRVFCSSLPGHHAYSDHSHGYCLLNPMATSVKKAQEEGFKNILILDWDFHHGDGTQSMFEHDASVYHISIHNAVDVYMSMMEVHEFGTTTYAEKIQQCNIPVLDTIYDEKFLEDVGFSGEYCRHYDCKEKFIMELKKTPFTPDLIFIFSGFDAHIGDCGEGVTNWDDDDFRHLTNMVVAYAKNRCPIISTTGGGYNLDSNLGAAKAHVDTLFQY
jgi:acetoin utilization deacetylase AcuC-like enzyme